MVPQESLSGLVLVVDDEADIVDNLVYNLRKAGHSTRSAETGEAALAAARLTPVPDLVLLDLMLPDMSGLEVCRRLKGDPHTATVPVVMLTARGSEYDRVSGFEAGADDYVVKPFSTRELLLRVQARLRARPVAVEDEEVLVHGDISLHPAAFRVRVEATEVELTALEFKLLAYLMRKPGRVRSRAKLIDKVWEVVVEERTVDATVKRLRQKLGSAGSDIETIRGVGYRLRDEVGALRS